MYPATIQSFYNQQVDVKVISGDNIETVQAIASQAGIRSALACTGAELEAMNADQFARTVRNTNIFARIAPDTKRKIVASLRQQGLYTAMIGDGVNDVPALKEANLAIAMNDGAQIAKDVADLVLLNNAVSTLPLAFSEGRTITRKIYGTTRLFLVKNFVAVFLIIASMLLALPFPITPLQISWLTFIMVNVPAFLITFGVVQPTYFREFGNDILKGSLTTAAVGTLGGALIYGLTYFSLKMNVATALSDPSTFSNQDLARSSLFLFLGVFSTWIFCQTHGINPMKLGTVYAHRQIIVIGLGLLFLTILPALFFTMAFDFTVPPLGSLLMIFGVLPIIIIGTQLCLRPKDPRL